MADLESIKREVALANRMLAATGLVGGVSAALGHVSCRIPDDPDHFVIKGLWKPLAQAGAGDMLVVDMNGFKTEGPRALNLPNEVKMHSCILRERPEVNSVVHCHPRFAVMMSVLELPLTPMRIEGMQLLARPLPVFPSPRLIIREEDGAEVAQLIGDSPAILLRGHGVATAGKSMEDARDGHAPDRGAVDDELPRRLRCRAQPQVHNTGADARVRREHAARPPAGAPAALGGLDAPTAGGRLAVLRGPRGRRALAAPAQITATVGPASRSPSPLHAVALLPEPLGGPGVQGNVQGRRIRVIAQLLDARVRPLVPGDLPGPLRHGDAQIR